MKEMNVALRLKAHDNASREMRRTISEVDRNTQRSSQNQSRAAARAQNSVRREITQTQRTDKAASISRVRDAEQSNRVVLNESRRLHQARARLGITSERSLQQEVIRTAAAYKRLEQSGKLSGRELARAADAAQAKIKRLQSEMGRFGNAQNFGKGMLAIGGGLMAGAAMAKQPLSQTMDYDRQIAMISNAAFSERDAAGRQAGQASIKEAISSAVKQGGGTRESAADTLYALMGDGSLSRDAAISLLPTMQKLSLATGSSGSDLAGLVGALGAQGVSETDLPNALGKILHASETSGFGMDAMLSSLPQILQEQKLLGLSGVTGLDSALASLQGVTAETGQSSIAAQSTISLLQALRNPEVAKRMSETLAIDGKGVDLMPTLSQGAAQGVNPLETLAGILDKSMASNSTYKNLQAKLQAEGSGQDAMDQMTAFLDSTILKDLGINKNAIGALSGYLKQRSNIAALQDDYAGRGIEDIDTSALVMMSTDSERVNQASQSITEARQKAMEPITAIVGDVSEKLAEYAQQYPTLTSAVVGATDAIKVMTAAAITFGGIKMLTGGKGGALSKGIGAASGNIIKSAPSIVQKIGKNAAKRAPLVAAGIGLYEGYGIINSDASDEGKKIALTKTAGSTAGAAAGAWGGAAAGAAMGSIVPGVGTAVGGIVGGILGGWGGGELFGSISEKLGKSWFSSSSSDDEKQDDPEPIPLAVDVNVAVDVENGNIVAAVNEVNARDARRH